MREVCFQNMCNIVFVRISTFKSLITALLSSPVDIKFYVCDITYGFQLFIGHSLVYLYFKYLDSVYSLISSVNCTIIRLVVCSHCFFRCVSVAAQLLMRDVVGLLFCFVMQLQQAPYQPLLLNTLVLRQKVETATNQGWLIWRFLFVYTYL